MVKLENVITLKSLRTFKEHADDQYISEIEVDGEKITVRDGKVNISSESLTPELSDYIRQEDITEATEDDIAVLFSGVERPSLKQYGYLKTKVELDSLIKPGESAYIDHDTDVFYCVFSDQLTEGNHYAAVLELDDKSYAVVLSDFTYHYFGLGKGAGHNTDADFIKTEGHWSSYGRERESVEVAGKSVKFSLLRYDREVTETVLAEAPAEKILDHVTIDCSSSVSRN